MPFRLPAGAPFWLPAETPLGLPGGTPFGLPAGTPFGLPAGAASRLPAGAPPGLQPLPSSPPREPPGSPFAGIASHAGPVSSAGAMFGFPTGSHPQHGHLTPPADTPSPPGGPPADTPSPLPDGSSPPAGPVPGRCPPGRSPTEGCAPGRSAAPASKAPQDGQEVFLSIISFSRPPFQPPGWREKRSEGQIVSPGCPGGTRFFSKRRRQQSLRVSFGRVRPGPGLGTVRPWAACGPAPNQARSGPEPGFFLVTFSWTRTMSLHKI